MKCECGGCLRIRQTYQCGEHKTQRAVCQKCGVTHTLVTINQGQVGHGNGAYSLAKRMLKGAKPNLTFEESPGV